MLVKAEGAWRGMGKGRQGRGNMMAANVVENVSGHFSTLFNLLFGLGCVKVR